jgi:hypothetical protein
MVRLGIYRGEHVLLYKQLVAQGDDAGAIPFEKMSLCYERSAVGAHGENPAGVHPTSRPPNVFDPRRPHLPAGFGPIAGSWPTRARLLGAFDPTRLEDPILELPDDFPWLFFQAAPSDQRLGFLRGDETIVIDGMTASTPSIESQLPGLSGVARVHTRAQGAGPGEPISLFADTLSIDADMLCCSMIWRGTLVLRGDAEPGELLVVAHLATAKTSSVRARPTTQLTMTEGHGNPQPRAAVLPFVAPTEGASIHAAAPTHGVSAREATQVVKLDREDSTADLPPEQHRQIAPHPATPFRPAPSLAPPPIVERREPALPPEPKSLGAHFLTVMAILPTRADAPQPH